jgi:hypothetical protein
LEFELSDFETENATLKGNYLRQVVEIMIGGVQNVLGIRFMCWFMPLGRILLQGSVSTYLFNPVRHQVDLWKFEGSISLHGNVYLMADIILPGIHFAPLVGRRPCFSFGFIVYRLLLHELGSQGIGFGLRLFADSHE